jgi:hypothetical protein
MSRTAPSQPSPSRRGIGLVLLLMAGTLLAGSCCVGSAAFLGWFGAAPEPETPTDPMVADAPSPKPPQPVPVTFDPRGDFTFQTTLDLDDPDPREPSQCRRRFTLDVKADTVCVIEVADRRDLSVRVEPIGGGPAIEPKDAAGARPFVLWPAKPETFTITASGRSGEAGEPFTLHVRAWDEGMPLPEPLKFPAAQTIPRLEVLQRLQGKLFVGGAFAPDGSAFWTAQHDMTLTLWRHPAVAPKGTYLLKQRLYALAIDRKGRLYAQPGPPDKNPPGLAPRPVGDLHVYDRLDPKGDADEMPPPAHTILLRGRVERLIASPGGRWIYFLDVHNHKLGRIDTDAAAVDRSVEDLSPDTLSFCLTPDGKKLYTCSAAGRLDVIDAASFEVERSVALDRGKPHDIAATDRGIAFLIGQELVDGASSPRQCGLVDLARSGGETAHVMPMPCGHDCQYLQMLPAQNAVLIAGDRKVSVCAVPARPALQHAECREFPMPAATPGWMQVSPDGRTLLHDSGTILLFGP